MAIKGCWTCRRRKVRCDSLKPTCGNCAKSRRTCEGYGIQLSWPREGDRKRAIVLRGAQRLWEDLPTRVNVFLNTSSWDTSLSRELESGTTSAKHFRTMQVPRLTYLSPIVMDGGESQLVQFFNESRSLILGPTDEEMLANFILKIAFSSSVDSSNPVLQGIFALASLQLHGDKKSFPYKHRVMSSITGSIDWLNEKALLQNLMATMLLYHYELSLDSESKGSWVTFLCTVKRIMNTTPAVYKLIKEEYSLFLDWIYYHEVLGEFTVRHWKVPYMGCGWAPEARSPRPLSGRASHVQEIIGCPVDVLELLTQVCRSAIAEQPVDGVTGVVPSEYAKVLEKSIISEVAEVGPIPRKSWNRSSMVSDLHRLACLIYVNRTSHRVSNNYFHHKRLVREGILLLTEMETCQSAWPLFIIACEATEDHQRLAVLTVFERSLHDARRRSNHIHFIQHLVESVWSQMDLNFENEVDYVTILNAVIGGIPFIPPFA